MELEGKLAAQTVSRILELSSSEAKWNRRLWRTGTLQLGREFLGQVVDPSTSVKSKGELAKHLRDAFRNDPGVKSINSDVQACLSEIGNSSSRSSHAWLMLQKLLEQADREYLASWQAHIEGCEDFEPEGCARRLTSHLVDVGYNKQSIHSWLRSADEGNKRSVLIEFVSEAGKRIAKKSSFTFCVPVANMPKFRRQSGQKWLTASQTLAWKKENAPEAERIRHQGSFVLEVEAFEINGALERARSQIFDLQCQFDLGCRQELKICDQMWSAEKAQSYPTQNRNRHIEVKTLAIQNRDKDLELPAYIGSTLSLIHPLRTSPPHLALSTGWTAVESLLTSEDDQDKSVAAGRFALIIAVSLVRAELTQQAWTYANQFEDELAQNIRGAEDNLTRTKLYQQLVMGPAFPVFEHPADQLAVSRMADLLADPPAVLLRTKLIIERELLRLYRKRNQVVHGGETRDDSLFSASELVSPLISAGMDRIVYVGLRYGVAPMDLSARLNVSLSTYSLGRAFARHDVLEAFECG
ncbi:MAG: hypothetical protein Q4G50_00010 [Corynebacterium sp.]|uniref:hypothetical protein n=1 Tax=Corynebacterium sp. TaxID=1720 RepID=UPI0026DEA195|nr:hypothetical protein [Corynebacterium sp.]MDO5668373.1 hypothetical protein [Corynebacterium sp.]